MGLGVYPLVSLALAREMAIGCSLKWLKGIDPLEERAAEKRQRFQGPRRLNSMTISEPL